MDHFRLNFNKKIKKINKLNKNNLNRRLKILNEYNVYSYGINSKMFFLDYCLINNFKYLRNFFKISLKKNFFFRAKFIKINTRFLIFRNYFLKNFYF